MLVSPRPIPAGGARLARRVWFASFFLFSREQSNRRDFFRGDFQRVNVGLPLPREVPGSTWDTVVTDATAESTPAAGSNGGTPIYHSTKLEETTLEGDFMADINTTSLAIFSDDGSTVTIDGVKVWAGKDQRQTLEVLSQSLHKLPITLNPGQTYHIKIDYSNIVYLGDGDIDGVTLFTWTDPLIVTADTSGITAANFHSQVAVQASGPLNASVGNAPQTTAHCTVNAPTWSWAYGNVQYSVDGKNFVNPPVSYAVSISQPLASSPAATFNATFNQIGYWAVAVTATVTYTSNCGSISGSGTDDIGSVNGGQTAHAITRTYHFQVASYVGPHIRRLHSTVMAGRKSVTTSLSLLYNGVAVTSTPIPVMVGQQIQLTAKFSTGNLQGPYIPLWTVSGDDSTRVANYTQTLDYTGKKSSGVITPLASPLTGNAISFYWIAGSLTGTAQTTTCSINFYQTYNSSVNFLVFRPDAKDYRVTPPTEGFLSDSTTHNPPVFIGDNGDNDMRLCFGTTASAGIFWKTILFNPAIGVGTIALTQLIDRQLIDVCATDGHTISALTKDANGKESYFLDDIAGIQANFNGGPGPTAIPGSFAGSIDSLGGDYPNTSLTKAISKASATDHFHTYLMYKPAGANSIWVTLSRMDWSWSGFATRNIGSSLDQSSTYGDWSLDKNADGTLKITYPASPPVGVTSTELPVWGNYYTSLHLNCGTM